MGIEVFYQILLALWVSLDTPYDTATNSACQLSVHGLSRKFFLSIDEHYFNAFFTLSIFLRLENESL